MSDTQTDNLSETISDHSSVNSYSNSIFQEFEELVNRFEDFHTHIHNSFETLQNIHKLVLSHNNILVTYNNHTGDFDEFLEELHHIALDNIKDNNPANFGTSLIKILDIAEFH